MPGPFDVDRDMRGKRRTVDREMAELARSQHGVVARHQLLALGLGPDAIDRRNAAGRLHALHRGVYAVGHSRVDTGGRWIAAVLACGSGALLSHRSAAALWDLAPLPAGDIDVTARRRRARPGIAMHGARVDPRDRTELDGIPVTAVARTLVDLAQVIDSRRLRRAFEQAERLQLLDLEAVSRLRERSRNRRGAKAVGRLLDERFDVPETRSELERRFLDLCRGANIPPPAVNVQIEGLEVDMVWPQQQLVVELDGFAFHHTRAAFERDRARDAILQLAGYRVLRLTSRQLQTDPAAVAETVRALLDTG